MKCYLKSGFTLYTNDDETMLIAKRCTMRNSMCTEKLSQFRGNKSQAVVKKQKILTVKNSAILIFWINLFTFLTHIECEDFIFFEFMYAQIHFCLSSSRCSSLNENTCRYTLKATATIHEKASRHRFNKKGFRRRVRFCFTY